MPDAWDPAQYDRFKAERRRPFLDLLAWCRPVPGGSGVDLGCGPGSLTVELADALELADMIGIDSSPAMLEQAQAHARPGVRFELGDLARWDGPAADVVVASASMHWVGDHPALLGRIRRGVAPGGQLAFQVPANFAHPSHTVARQVAAEEPFVSLLAANPPYDAGAAVLSPQDYAELLYDLGASDQRVRLEVYGHLLPSSADVVEWTKGTLLTSYRDRLDEAAFDRFVERYRERLLSVLGEVRPYFFAFPRLLAWARFE